MDFESAFSRPMTPMMERAAAEFETRLDVMGEDSPESLALADTFNALRSGQVIFEALGAPYTAGDLVAAACLYYQREELFYLRADPKGRPLPANVLAFTPPAAG
jgi:hypothetical protein